jgi:hypothetical protein
MTSPEQADVEASREAFLAGKGTPGSDYHLTLLMAPFHLNLVVGEDRKSLLAYARKVWGAALASVALESQGAGSDEIASLAGLAASSGVPPDSGQMLGAADQDVSEVLRPNEKEGQGAVALHPQPPDVHLACPQEHAAAAREADERSLPAVAILRELVRLRDTAHTIGNADWYVRSDAAWNSARALAASSGASESAGQMLVAAAQDATQTSEQDRPNLSTGEARKP